MAKSFPSLQGVTWGRITMPCSPRTRHIIWISAPAQVFEYGPSLASGMQHHVSLVCSTMSEINEEMIAGWSRIASITELSSRESTGCCYAKSVPHISLTHGNSSE